MRRRERGFSTLELIVGLGISVVIGAAAVGGTGQLWNSSASGNDYISAVSGVQQATLWIGRDCREAESITTDNLSANQLVTMSWTEYKYGEEDTIYHSVTYYFSNLSDNVGELRRLHWSSVTGDVETLVATNIYYDPSDVDETSEATLADGMLQIRLVAQSDGHRETREIYLAARPEIWTW